MEKENDLYGIPIVRPPTLLAYQPELNQPPVQFEKVINLSFSTFSLYTNSVSCVHDDVFLIHKLRT